MPLVLGLQTGHESSAALFENGRLLAAVSDERLSRIKNDGGQLSSLAIDEVLRIAGRQRSDVDRLALLYTFFPEEYFVRETLAKRLESGFARLRGRRRQMHVWNFIERLRLRGERFEDHFREHAFLSGERFDRAAVRFHDHHESHAVPAGYFSGFDRCAVITMDGNGDANISHTSGRWSDGKYLRDHVTDAHGASPGLFYGHVTELLGFRVMRHEGKVVGLAAMGDPDKLRGALSRALRVAEDGLTLTSDFSGGPESEERRRAHIERSARGHSREDIAASAQAVLEDAVVTLARNYLRRTGERRLALNGGVFANVKLNQRLANLPEVDEVFVFPAMSDTGNSVGAALLDMAATRGDGVLPGERLEHVYWGPEFGVEEIAGALESAGVKGVRCGDADLVERAAQAIHAGKVVGWFQGRMEFGPRALGNRSMLARPTDAAINDWLNTRLDRSEFMPFAPSVLADRATEIFTGVEKARHSAEFMTITFDVKPEWRHRIPAVVHVDGTARPQLVREVVNPLYFRLISRYEALSGIPLVLNTSFNVHEEPIVCGPVDAVRAFSEGRVDCLAVGPFWAEHP